MVYTASALGQSAIPGTEWHRCPIGSGYVFGRLVAITQRAWNARCLTCGHRFPLPGIRIGAAGRPAKLLRCPRCERWRCCRVEPIPAA